MPTKSTSRKNVEVKDVPADNPVGTMDRFADGLRHVLAAPKAIRRRPSRTPRKQKHTR
jgi:hypothetical protein